MLPADASKKYSKDLLAALKQYSQRDEAPVWKNAENVYREMVIKAKEAVSMGKKTTGKRGGNDNDLTSFGSGGARKLAKT